MKYLVERRLRDGAHLRRTRPRHHSYWRRMARDRVLLYGGVWAEGPGDTLIVQVDDATALRRLLGGDPYVHESLVVDIRTRQLGDGPSWHHAGPPERPSHAGPSHAGPGTSAGGGNAAFTAVGTGTGTGPGPAGGPATAAAVRDRAAAPPLADEALSAHESRISHMMLDGMTNRQMAACLGVSSRAVEQHITRIYRKLAISRRAQLAVALHGRPAA